MKKETAGFGILLVTDGEPDIRILDIEKMCK